MQNYVQTLSVNLIKKKKKKKRKKTLKEKMQMMKNNNGRHPIKNYFAKICDFLGMKFFLKAISFRSRTNKRPAAAADCVKFLF